MNKRIFNFLILPTLLLTLFGCNQNDITQQTSEDKPQEEDPPIEATYKDMVMQNDNFKIINFADTQFSNPREIKSDSILTKTISKSIEDSNPDLITFSGDNAWQTLVTACYKNLCSYMDKFKIPYCFVFGNHDRENAKAKDIASIINNSKYGFIYKGTVDDYSYGNYVVNIKNKNNETIHKLLMMDSRSYSNNQNVDFVNFPVEGMLYNSAFGHIYYGNITYDSIRDKQFDWYENEIKDSSIESTIITHMPIRQYYYAYEEYLEAIRTSNSFKLEELSPIGECALDECISCSSIDYGFFDLLKEKGSTKNFICGHDHINDFSLMYNGIRLSYALKTGDGCYWKTDGSRNGCTEIKIDASGKASISYHFYQFN